MGRVYMYVMMLHPYRLFKVCRLKKSVGLQNLKPYRLQSLH